MIDPNLQIVLCDCSDFNLKPIIEAKFPNKNIECLSFLGSSDLIAKRGKGYGEGEIIEYALNHSNYLRDADAFVKCTGKLWVENFHKCLNEWNGIFSANAHFQNIFNLKKTEIDIIDTRFYISNKKFFIQNLLAPHFNSGYEAGSSIENLFLKKIADLNLQKFLFVTEPMIYGMGGGSGKYYKNNTKRFLKNNIKRMLIRNSESFKKLFHDHCKN